MQLYCRRVVLTGLCSNAMPMRIRGPHSSVVYTGANGPDPRPLRTCCTGV